VACGSEKKLIVPTVHPVGPITHHVTPRGFSVLYSGALLGLEERHPRSISKTRYVQSPFGFVHPNFSPASLSKSSYLAWVSKLCRPRGKFLTSVEYLRALNILRAEFAPFIQPGFSSIEEILPDIDWEKSPGWPYVNEGCTTKRQAWAKFKDVIIDRAERLVRGEYVECLFIASPKDELLPPGKNARIFLPAPFHHYIACAMLFKKSCDSLTATVHRHSSAIGIDIFGRGLERALRSLSSLPYGFDADQSGCDTSWKDPEPERDFLKDGLSSHYHAGVDMLFNTAMCPRVLLIDRVVQIQMNPSGWYLTSLVNTLMTHRVVAAAYLDLSPTHETIDEMRNHLKQLNGGDDLAYSTDREWFDILSLANEVSTRGIYLESDFLVPRDPMRLTFFSHNLMPRHIDINGSTVLVACGRLSKMVSAFSFLKTKDGAINWLRNASRVVGIMTNLWAYKFEFDLLYPYLYHMIHHFFLLDGQNLSSEWSGVFKGIPSDDRMLALRAGHAHQESFLFSSPCSESSSMFVKRTLQSALKSASTRYHHLDTNSMPNDRKINRILDSLERHSTLSKDGRDWLISACDPFHDSDFVLAGYPDLCTDATIVQLVKKQLQIAVPTSGNGQVTAGSNWDCSIAMFPTLNTYDLSKLYSIDGAGNFFNPPNSTSGTVFGCLTVSSGPQGTDLWPLVGTESTSTTSQTLENSQYCKGNLRIIGAAFEVINTTAEINKQGQVTVWRMPSTYTDSTYFGDPNAPTGTNFFSWPCRSVRLPPANISNAQLLFGSRSWAAKEGAYVVLRQNSPSNPLSQPSFHDLVWTDTDTQSGAVQNVLTSDAGFGGQRGMASDVNCPFDISGATFTGLSYNTTLTINCRWLIERMPAPAESDLVVLATPSASYDPLALELYMGCMRDMPPGVMLSENPLGEWFSDVLGKVAEFAPKVGAALGAIGVPGASLIGTVAGRAAGEISQAVRPAPKSLPPPMPIGNSITVVKKAKQKKSKDRPKSPAGALKGSASGMRVGGRAVSFRK
jgi:hypothetical protein